MAGIHERIEAIEECYEFMLAYAAQGRPDDTGTPVREMLFRAAVALGGITEECAAEFDDERPPFLEVLERDARATQAAIELVLVQRAISSQLIDNLNASIHVRALLTDVFLVGEVLREQRVAASRV